MFEFGYVNDKSGERVAVLLPIKDYEQMKEIVEEYEDIMLYRQAKSEHSETVSFDDAFREIENC